LLAVTSIIKTAGVAASLLAVFAMLGGHWLALQSVAWTRMLAEFSMTDTFSKAVVKTFDGNHPCQMCLGIRERRTHEQRQQQERPWLNSTKSPDLLSDVRRVSAPAPPTSAADAIAFVPRPAPDFLDAPPTPPPRLLSFV
jgi:hypothetical protein